jgi:hypothetical protein
MKASPIPEDAQIRAMLDGSIYTLLGDYVRTPEQTDFRKFITVTRQRLINFLSAHPEIAENYFQKHSSIETFHDTGKIWRDGSDYLTAWIDHGQAQYTKRFSRIAEAVAEHVLVAHLMY